MTIVTSVYSTTVTVADQDRALAFYRDVLGCTVRADFEAWPGARVVEVVPPGSDDAVALLTAESGLPLGVRWATGDADSAHRELTAAGFAPHTDVLRLDGAPPMFTVGDQDGNTVILMQDDTTPSTPVATAASAPGAMPVAAVLAAVPVRDPDAARAFYEQLLGAAPDVAPMPGLAEWHLGAAGVLQVVVDAERAGGGLVSLQVENLAAVVEAARGRGVDVEASAGSVVTAFARVIDPDGNAITLVQA